jgi:predicted nucleotidyltransferase
MPSRDISQSSLVVSRWVSCWSFVVSRWSTKTNDHRLLSTRGRRRRSFCYHRVVSDDDSLSTLRRTVAGTPELSLLVLFGSRARGSDRPSSDWDFGYVASRGFDPDHLLGVLVDTLNSDRIDLVDLRRAGAPLRYRAARDGRVVAEAENGEFARFWLDAVSFWCDVQPLLRRGYDAVLAELGP